MSFHPLQFEACEAASWCLYKKWQHGAFQMNIQSTFFYCSETRGCSLPINDTFLQNGCNNQYICLKMFWVPSYWNTEKIEAVSNLQWICKNLFLNVFHLFQKDATAFVSKCLASLFQKQKKHSEVLYFSSSC